MKEVIGKAHEQVSHSLHLTAELLGIAEEFEKKGIRMLALKGPVLSVLAYSQPASRTFCDLDLLVPPDAVARASDVLQARGYGPLVSTHEAQGCHRIFVRDRDNATVELHWALFPPALQWPLEQTGIWERAQEVHIGGKAVPTLGPEDTVIFLCLHGFKHRWSRLKWVCDMRFALQPASNVDWTAVVARSQEIGCYRAVLIGVILASELLGFDVPAELQHNDRSYSIARSLASRYQESIGSGDIVDGAELLICEVHSRDRALDSVFTLTRALSAKWRPNCHDQQTARLPHYLGALYYLIRPLRLLSTYGLGWVKPLLCGR
jgi:hypothetical protein